VEVWLGLSPRIQIKKMRGVARSRNCSKLGSYRSQPNASIYTGAFLLAGDWRIERCECYDALDSCSSSSFGALLRRAEQLIANFLWLVWPQKERRPRCGERRLDDG
jgi:hypothetical protein